MNIQEKIWEGNLTEIPLHVYGEILLAKFNRMITPIATVRPSMKLLRDNVEVVSCDYCLYNQMTSVLSFTTLSLKSDGMNNTKAIYDVKILCTGEDTHSSHHMYSLILTVETIKK
jgi:hypothetical protein